ncbi:MAG: hypothetical protein JSV63_02985 [Candidatus Aenigmatarchaeota archaeon]|nr:MAG: hypothetical protein JSV63_02985 [Candidatus Aenigmarchaeota archaeon]
MKKIEAFGSVLIVLGVGILGGYGLYMFLQAPEVPILIRLGAVTVIIGIVSIFISIIKERIVEKGGWSK